MGHMLSPGTCGDLTQRASGKARVTTFKMGIVIRFQWGRCTVFLVPEKKNPEMTSAVTALLSSNIPWSCITTLLFQVLLTCFVRDDISAQVRLVKTMKYNKNGNTFFWLFVKCPLFVSAEIQIATPRH